MLNFGLPHSTRELFRAPHRAIDIDTLHRQNDRQQERCW
jgi:hypothetical protein